MAKFKVAIFAGHNDNTFDDYGSKGIYTDLTESGVYEEYNSNIYIAKEVVRLLDKYDDIEALFPQADGRNMGLRERVDYCNDNNVDTAIFIHSNASSNKSASGACGFYWHSSTDGKRFAELYADEMKKFNYPLWSNGTYPCKDYGWSNFYVVRNTRMVVLLTENFFFSNPQELKDYLLNEDELKKIAIAHERSLVRYLGIEPIQEVKKEPVDKDWRIVLGKEGLDVLSEHNIINNPDTWEDKLLDKTDNWLLFTVVARAIKEMKGEK